MAEDEGDRERRLALAAARKFLPGKPAAVWLWLAQNQRAGHDDHGILAWMETQDEYRAAVRDNPPAANPPLPPDYASHINAETWDFFKILGYNDSPRPGSTAYKAWLANPTPQAKRLFPDLFPETPLEKARRWGIGLVCLALVIFLFAPFILPKWLSLSD
ncbi:MAG: hypothetical protein JNL35_14455 [Sphingopyxis sp.]|nr:hypothetical protein [Sphingopyxis sp.]